MSVPPFELAPPPPSPARECVGPPLVPKGGGQHSLAGEGAGGANSDDWREILAFCILCGTGKPMAIQRTLRAVHLCK